jgi:hypothetical protein
MSDRQAGECPPRSRWKSWRARPHVSRIARRRTLHQAIRCRMNCGIPYWPIRAPPAGRRCRSSNAASRKFRDTCCASNASAALASSKFRRRMPSDFTDRMPSGKMSGSDCSTRPAATAQAGWRRMDAGRIGGVRALSSSVASSFETHRFAMLLRMRSETLMVRSAATRVSNHQGRWVPDGGSIQLENALASTRARPRITFEDARGLTRQRSTSCSNACGRLVRP